MVSDLGGIGAKVQRRRLELPALEIVTRHNMAFIDIDETARYAAAPVVQE
jgi:hypothetical protein